MLKSVKIRNFSNIINPDGIQINIPEPGEVIVLSGKNGTGKTSILKIIKGGSSFRGSSFPFKDCENDLVNLDIEYTFMDEEKNDIVIQITRASDRYKYTPIKGINDGEYSSQKFGKLAIKGWNCKFLQAVGSRKSNLDEIIEKDLKKDSKLSCYNCSN